MKRFSEIMSFVPNFFMFGHFTASLFLCVAGDLALLERTIIEDFLRHLNKELENSLWSKCPLNPPTLAYNKHHIGIYKTHRCHASYFSGENRVLLLSRRATLGENSEILKFNSRGSGRETPKVTLGHDETKKLSGSQGQTQVCSFLSWGGPGISLSDWETIFHKQ